MKVAGLFLILGCLQPFCLAERLEDTNLEVVIQAVKEALKMDFEDRISVLEEKVAYIESLSVREEHREAHNDPVEDLDDLAKTATKDPLEDRVAMLEDLAKVGTLRTCAEYAEFGLSTNGYYTIDADGSLSGQPPFQVYCNFTDGSTEVLHDTEEITEVQHCHDPGCFNKSISYIDGETQKPIEMSQIVSLIQLSEHCEQAFQYDCTMAPLTDNDVNYAYWYDRHGQKNIYYTGSNYDFHVCDCFYQEGGCMEESVEGNRCNCDANQPIPLSDTGTILNMTALPVTMMFFGGLNYDLEAAKFKLGRLKCFGQADVQYGTSCGALKLEGVLRSGFYNIKAQGNLRSKLVFCDMSTETYSDVPQIEEVPDSSPIGSIVAWVPKPDSSSAKSPLPDGWVTCDGSTIAKGPWKGGKTPDLNNGGHFLRGGKEGESLRFQEDQMQDHQHVDDGHSHSAHSTATPHSHAFVELSYSDTSTLHYFSSSGVPCGQKAYHRTTDPDTVSVSTSISSATSGIGGVTSAYKKGTETRPKNMAITWVMRCW